MCAEFCRGPPLNETDFRLLGKRSEPREHAIQPGMPAQTTARKWSATAARAGSRPKPRCDTAFKWEHTGTRLLSRLYQRPVARAAHRDDLCYTPTRQGTEQHAQDRKHEQSAQEF